MARTWGSISSTVTLLPSAANIAANSMPTTPPPRDLLQLQDLVRVDRELRSREGNPRHRRTRRDDYVVRLELLLPRNVEDAFSREPSASLESGDAASLQQAID